MITVLLVDDQAPVRAGLRMRLGLEPDLEVIGEAEDGLEALELVRALRPDVVVMDVEMPCMDGIAAAQALSTIAPYCAVVILSLYGNVCNRKRAEEAGVAAFVAKQGDVEELISAIRSAAGLR
jgi:DNA-binding NarL/FixJ family response regulator